MELLVMLKLMANGFLMSLSIFGCTLLGAIPLGFVVSFARMNEWTLFAVATKVGKAKFAFKPIQLLAKIYISIMRGTPLMLQLMFIFFCPTILKMTFPSLAVPPNWRFVATIFAFVLNYAAYFAEIYRGGIESMPVGQYEAASVLGYSRAQTFFKIILPQVVKRILPSMTNETITLVKDTSIAYIIGVVEMFTLAKQISNSQKTLMPFLIAAIFYYVFNYVVAFVMERAEKALSYYR